jgi:hypothetical protein
MNHDINYQISELEIAVLIKMNEIRKKYLVTPFFVDQLSFNLTSFRLHGSVES